MEVMFSEQGQEFQEKGGVEHRFPSGKRYSSSRSFVELNVTKAFVQEFTGRTGLTHQREGIGRAFFSAPPTYITLFLADPLGSLKHDRPIGTDLCTFPAPDTAFSIKGHFLLSVNGLGVLAPNTLQRTAFEKDQGPDPRAVVNGKPLDVKDSGHWTKFRCSLSGGSITGFLP